LVFGVWCLVFVFGVSALIDTLSFSMH